MLGEAIKRLRDKTLSIKKSTLDPSASSDGGDQGKGENGGSTPEEVASQAVTHFETGELKPDLESVKEFAIKNGIPDGEADSFSHDVIDAYFGADPGKAEDGTSSADPTEDAKMAEMQKSLLAIEESQVVIAEGMEALLERQPEIDALKKEVLLLKSMLTKLQGLPANPKKPIEQTQVTKSVVAGAVPVDQRAEVEVAILKAIQAGELAVEEMTYFETTGKVSSEANVIISKYRGNK
ncbi:hypothetical protein [Leptospira jelokensis]|uniref:Uncharacterized protein n=1 Tax=Leptospira jelokensis TaxID=2484931 RepID=A0A4Z0ZNN2_9LEPT|nr:hypothetical protein [Leptospira jelokensis]TGL58626.1 hypothetical protein EHQ62_17170 [Leptospira jelokensis]